MAVNDGDNNYGKATKMMILFIIGVRSEIWRGNDQTLTSSIMVNSYLFHITCITEQRLQKIVATNKLCILSCTELEWIE